MSTQELEETEVEFMDNGETTVAVIDDEAYNLSEGDVVFHETGDETLLITSGDVYRAEYDEDGWLILSEDTPEFVLEALDETEERYADADAYGFPIELDVGFRSDEAVFSSAWQTETLRPSMDVARRIDGVIKEVTLTIEVDENGEVTVTDVSLWPNKSNVLLDIC